MRLTRRLPVRASWLWAMAALVAIATSVVVAADLATIHRRAGSFGPEVEVAVAARDLDLGTTVTRDDLELVRRHESQVPDWSESSLQPLLGRTVAVPVIEGAAVSMRHLAAAERSGAAGIVAPGTRAVRIPDPDGLAPEPGSLVDVIVAFDPATADQLGFTTITAATAAKVIDSTEPAGGFAVGAEAATKQSVLALVTAEEAERLAFAVANGSVTLALAPPETAAGQGSSVRADAS